MNPKPWLPLIASAMVGVHLLATKTPRMRAQMRGTWVRATGSADVRFGAMGPSKVWSSMAARMTHVVEAYSTIAITALFVAGTIGMFVGV